jgi:hypothetical protein
MLFLIRPFIRRRRKMPYLWGDGKAFSGNRLSEMSSSVYECMMD